MALEKVYNGWRTGLLICFLGWTVPLFALKLLLISSIPWWLVFLPISFYFVLTGIAGVLAFWILLTLWN